MSADRPDCVNFGAMYPALGLSRNNAITFAFIAERNGRCGGCPARMGCSLGVDSWLGKKVEVHAFTISTWATCSRYWFNNGTASAMRDFKSSCSALAADTRRMKMPSSLVRTRGSNETKSHHDRPVHSKFICICQSIPGGKSSAVPPCGT